MQSIRGRDGLQESAQRNYLAAATVAPVRRLADRGVHPEGQDGPGHHLHGDGVRRERHEEAAQKQYQPGDNTHSNNCVQSSMRHQIPPRMQSAAPRHQTGEHTRERGLHDQTLRLRPGSLHLERQ